jgi:hypothetical protein
MSAMMNNKENLQLFLSPRLTARSARAAQDEDKLGDLQVQSLLFLLLVYPIVYLMFFRYRTLQSGFWST